MRIRPLAAFAALVFGGVLGAWSQARAADLLCQAARPARAPRGHEPFPAFTGRGGLTVGDAFSHSETPPERLLDLTKPVGICAAIGETLPAEAYAVAPTQRPSARSEPRLHVVQTRLGIHRLRVQGGDRVLFPATWATGTTPPAATAALANGTRFACYRAKAVRGADPLRAVRMPLVGGSGTTPAALDLLRPVRLCVPADVNGDDPGAVTRDAGLLCFATRLPPAAGTARAARALVATQTLFGPEVLRTGMPYELCLPAARPDDDVPTPTATITADPVHPTPTPSWSPPPPEPTPTSAIPGLVSVAIDPPASTLRPGESIAFTATGTFEDGSTRDLSEELIWECGYDPYATDSACTAPNAPGERGRVVATRPDDFEIVYAWEPARAIGAYALLEVLEDPPLLKVHPGYTIIRQFDFDWLTAVRLESGVYRNATQDLVWSSSKPDVAVPTNQDGARSRIDALAPGIASIVATDPATGAVSAPVTFEIFGPLQRLDVHVYTGGSGAGTVYVGGTAWASAWGFFDYGFPFERLRGGIEFASSAPAVASIEVVPNEWSPLYPSHAITAHAVGRTIISAFDPLTGLRSTDHGCDVLVDVRNPPLGIRLAPDVRRAGLDETIRLTALGVAVDGTTRNLTQRVTYTSSDPTVVQAPNAWGDRSALRTVGPGTATITAVEDWPPYPRAPLTTNPLWVATIIVRNERADRVVVEPPLRRTVPFTFPRFTARAYYPSGATNPVTDMVVWTSSDEDVAAPSPFIGTRLAARAPGTTTITATLPSGVSSRATAEDGTLIVEAPEALTVSPPTATIPVGGSTTVTALAHLPSGAALDLFDRDVTPDPRWAPVYFLTSAPDVARSATCGAREYVYPLQPILGFAPGTTTIRAVSAAHWRSQQEGPDPPLDSGASGGDATITVTP